MTGAVHKEVPATCVAAPWRPARITGRRINGAE